MGVSIHYRGQLADPNTIYQLIEEVSDIAKTMGWQYKSMNEDWDMPPSARLESGDEPGIRIIGNCALKGIHFQAHEHCEPVWLYFNVQGILTSPFQVALDAAEGYPVHKPWLFTKTQYGGIDIHITVIKLLQYLKQKYLPDLEVEDESGYWETGDITELERRFHKVEEGLAMVQRSITNAGISSEDSEDEIIRKIKDATRRDDSAKEKN